VADPLAHTITATYDVQGRLVATTDANGHTTTYGFDALGRTIAVTDALTHTTRYAFDGLGRRVAVTDAAGLATHYEYDLLGRLVRVTENYSRTGPADEQTNVRTAYGYDPLGNRLYLGDARGYTTTYEYDALSRLVAETDPLTHTWEYGYDQLGRQIVVTDPLTVTTRTYDALGRLVQVEYGASVSAAYAYNALGGRTAMTDATGVTAYLYDDLGRVLLLTHSVTTTAAYTVGYGYDGRGLRTLLVYPDGTRVTSTYDLAGRLAAVDGVTTTYASYDYDPGNRLLAATLGNGVQTAYAYDAGNQLLAISHTLDGALLARFTYAYNAAGQRTRAVETVVAPELWAEILAETPPTATAPAGPYAVYLPAVPRADGAAVADLSSHPPTPSPLPQWGRGEGAAAAGGRGREERSIVREQRSFRATFDEQGLRYEPRERLVEVGTYFVDWRLAQARSGSTKLFQPGARPQPPSAPPGQPDRVRYDRGEYFREEYLITAGGVEQRFVLPRPFPVEGDLEIEGQLLGNLEPAFQDTGEIVFRSPAGEVVASYGRALVEEACGERLVAEIELTGRHVRIVVPREWLATACFPVVVDPLIGPNFAVSTQPLGGNQERVAVATGAAGRLLAAWHGAAMGTDTYAQVLSAAGLLVSGTVPLDARSADQQYPDAAGNPGAGSYLAVWQHDAGVGVPNWDLAARLVYSDGSYGANPITVYAGTYNQEYPAVAFNANDQEYLVVWRSYNTFSGQYGIYGQVVAADGTLPGTAVARYTATAQLSYPNVTFNVSDTQYLVTWQKYTSALAGWDVQGRRTGRSGRPLGGAFTIAGGTNDQALPAAAYSVSATAYLVAWQHYSGTADLNDARAAWVSRGGSVGSAFGVATGTDDQRAPDVACGAAGECLVAWERQAAQGVSGWDILARRVDDSGTVGSAQAIYDGNLDQRYPAAAYNALTAEYVVGGQDYRSGSAWDVYVQRVDADGSLDGDEVLASAGPADEYQGSPAVAYGTEEETHLVVWTDGRNGNDDIYGQFVAGGGALVGPAFAIANDQEDYESTPAVAYDAADDEYLVVWAHWDSKTEEADVYGQRVDGAGTLLGLPLAVCTAAAGQYDPAIVYNATTGHFLVAWQDNRAEVQDLYARAISGTTALAEFLVGTEEGSNMLWIDIAANPAGGEYLVVWRQSGDIYARRAGITETYSAAFTISTASAWEAAPAVAFDVATGTYLAIWARPDGAQQDIYGQRVSATGELLGSELTIASGAPSQSHPAVAANGAGGYVVAWQEGSSNSDIAAAVVDGTGRVLGGGAETLSAAANTQGLPALSYDSARGRYLAVWADYRNSAEEPDVYGQLYRDYTVAIDYRYDPLDRLVGADYSTGIHFAYAFDAVGNRTVLTETTPLSGTIVTTYTFDAANRLTARAVSDGRSYTYAWSDRGEMLAETTQGVDVRDGPIPPAPFPPFDCAQEREGGACRPGTSKGRAYCCRGVSSPLPLREGGQGGRSVPRGRPAGGGHRSPSAEGERGPGGERRALL
jgi:YD repeat-containing protein